MSWIWYVNRIEGIRYEVFRCHIALEIILYERGVKTDNERPDPNNRSIGPEQSSHVNVGTGKDVTIGELSLAMKKITGFEGGIAFDNTKPDGPARKLLSVEKLSSLGWESAIVLETGLESTYTWFKNEC